MRVDGALEVLGAGRVFHGEHRFRDELAVTGNGDSVSLMARALTERQVIGALLRAVGRGAHLRLLLDPDVPGTQAAAAELLHDGAGNVEVRWQAGADEIKAEVLDKGAAMAAGGVDLASACP